MRVLHIIVDNSLMGGITRHVQNVVFGMLMHKDVEVAVCTVFPSNEFNVMIEKKGAKSYSLNLNNHNDLMVFWRFRNVMLDYRPDLVHIHVAVSWIWMYLAWFARKIDIVMTIHSSYARPSFLKRLFRAVFHIPIRRYYYISDSVKRSCEANYGEGEVAYNPAPKLNLDDKGRLRRILCLDKNIKIIGTACKIGAVKRPEIFTRVMAEVLRRRPDTHAVVIGDGPNDAINSLVKIVESYGVLERFHFTGYREDSQILLSGIDVFVMTSEREGMPTALLEAIGAGVPVAFMNGRGGLLDLRACNRGSDGPFGIDVDANDVQSMIEGVCHLLDDFRFYEMCSRNARTLCEHRFSCEKVVEQLIQSYSTILRKG